MPKRSSAIAYRASNRVVFSPGLKRSGPDDFFNSIMRFQHCIS
jgi:hypothetical protein